MVVKAANKPKMISDPPKFSRLDAVLVVIALLLAAGIMYYYFSGNSTLNQTQQVPQVTAVSGSLAQGFPQEFIPNGLSITQSFLQQYSDGSKLWNANFTSDSSPQDILSGYTNLFGFLRWEITRSSDSLIYAKNDNTQVSVNISAAGSGSQGSISVLQK